MCVEPNRQSPEAQGLNTTTFLDFHIDKLKWPRSAEMTAGILSTAWEIQESNKIN